MKLASVKRRGKTNQGPLASLETMAKTKQFLYVMQANSGSIKVGIAANVEKRRKQIQTGNADKLEIIETFGPFTLASKIEFAIHARLRHSRMAGEWFSESSESAISIIKDELCSFIDEDEPKEACRSTLEDMRILFGTSFDNSIVGMAMAGTLQQRKMEKPLLEAEMQALHSLVQPTLLN